MEYGANPNLQDEHGFSPLHRAIFTSTDESVDIAKILIAYGADINAQDKCGNTPLHKANSIETIKLLLGEGARITIENRDWQLPLKTSITNFKNKNKGNEEAVKTLEEMINNYINNPRSLKLLAKCCIRERLVPEFE